MTFPKPNPTNPRRSRRADDGLLETHLQTQQKLEIMVRYWEVWCSILSRATGHAFCVASLWLVDCFAGRGLHPTNAHPDGVRAGTPVQAFRAAVQTTRRSPRSKIHLRAVDIDKVLAQELERRLVRARSEAHLNPDWKVLPQSFASARPGILAEMTADRAHGHSSGPEFRSHDHRSLWLIDPDGVRDIPHIDLEPLEQLRGAELIINLDLGGLLRVTGAALLALNTADRTAFHAAIKSANAKRMDLTWGSAAWRDAIDMADPADILGSLAQAYADTFPGFEYRNAYVLRGTKSQKRYLIHLTHSPRAASAFRAIWKACFNIDTLVSEGLLSESVRASRAIALHGQFGGTTTTVSELYELGMGDSRQQLRSVCRAAEDCGFGTYDQRLDQMEWYAQRQPDPTLGLFDAEPA